MENINYSYTKLESIRHDSIFYVKYKNNGNQNLAVNGAVTPVRFTLEDLVNENFLLTRIDFIITTDESIDISKFGNVPTLANGIVFNVDGQQIFRNNADILLFGTDTSIYSAKVEGVLSSIINGHWDVSKSFLNVLVSKKSELYIDIQDDLSAITLFEVAVSGIKLKG